MRKIIAIGFILLLLPCGIIFQLLWSVNSFLFNPGFYSTIVRESDIVNNIYTVSGVQQTFVETQEFTEGIPLLEDFVNAFSPSPDELNWQLEGIVEDLYRVFDNQQDYISYQLNLSGLRDLISGDEGVLLLYTYGSNLVECQPDQDPFSPPGFTSTTLEPLPLPMCRLNDFEAEQFGELLASRQSEILASWPQAVTYIVPVVRNPQERATLQGFVDFRDGLRGTMLTFGGLSAIFLGMAVLLGGRTRHGRLRWAGVSVLPPAVAIVLFGSMLSSLVATAVVPVTAASSVEEMMESSLVGALAGGVTQAVGTFWMTGVFFIVVGAALFVFGSRLGSVRLKGMTTAAVANVSDAGTAIKDGLRTTIEDERVKNTIEQGSKLVDRGKETFQRTIQDERVKNTMEQGSKLVDRGKETFQRTIQDERVQSTMSNGINFLKRGAGEARARLDNLKQGNSTDADPATTPTTTSSDVEGQQSLTPDTPSLDLDSPTDLPPSPDPDTPTSAL